MISQTENKSTVHRNLPPKALLNDLSAEREPLIWQAIREGAMKNASYC